MDSLTRALTVGELLAAGRDEDVALAAPGRQALTYAGLREQVLHTVTALNERGIGRNDRVAIVLPNGPEMASAFVSVAAGATTAPLNPGYKESEFDFYLSDLRAKTLLVEEGSDSPALAAAERLGIPILQLRVEPGRPAGAFELGGDLGRPAGSREPGEGAGTELGAESASPGGMATRDDIALVLHTSGTTSRPKIVPLAQRNICASAANIRRTLGLTDRDRCMNVMPLFHIHGLMAATLAPLSAGASIFCTPGFNALKFFTWLEEARPTYYSAVPTMHQAILARASRNREVLDRVSLRFIRSSSSSLPPRVMAELEETFGAPVIEAYAMTEAAHQMTCNPLPPGERKPGTVGIAAGPEVSIMDEAGTLLPPGAVGEVVIRGANVTDGYESNAEANAAAFVNGWFRTGDQGRMDEAGYLTITGRLKEIINRGGEKVSPREVDEVLMDHPAVQQVVTFAVPHEKLGEEVAAAAVLREGEEASPQEIRDFAAARLADFKVPRQVVLLDEIPKGPTGKLQRIGLAEKLGLA
ncbi:MAG: acyl--CoA ligase [Gemmatimonadota bacterium]